MEKSSTKHSVTFSTAANKRRPWRLALFTLVTAAAVKSWDVTRLGMFFLLLIWPRKQIVAESVMAVTDVGVQLTTRLSDGSEQHTFVPVAEIQDIVINEAPAGFRIRTYIVLVGKQNKNYLPFEHSELSIKTSAEILFALRAVVFGESDIVLGD